MELIMDNISLCQVSSIEFDVKVKIIFCYIPMDGWCLLNWHISKQIKSFTPGLLLSSGMEINNSLLFGINLLRLNPPLQYILMTFLTGSLLYQDRQPTLIDHLHRSCFLSQLLLSQTPQHCQQMFSLRHNLHSWLNMVLQRHGHTLQSWLDLHLCCDHSTPKFYEALLMFRNHHL